jgi:UDP:flavonoid glycosyltransferase YjiC (YdhE family)
VGLGDGGELRVINDALAFTNRFDGWASWRHTVTSYLAPVVASDVAQLRRVCEAWRPEVVVAGSFAVAGRLVARSLGVPCIELSIYPQHDRLGVRPQRFARPYVRAVRAVAHELGIEVADEVLWPSPDASLLHDPALLGSGVDGRALGFPTWDGLSPNTQDGAALEAFLGAGPPPIVVTLGSFIGLASAPRWHAIGRAIAASGHRAVFVGARGGWADGALPTGDGYLRTGFVPLSRLAQRAIGVVHHGGIGTTFAVLRAGRAAVVLPQAYDQAHNARLLEGAGVGIDGSSLAGRDLIAAVEAVADPRAGDRAAVLAADLTPSDIAATRAADLVRSAAGA